jgi:hypothetical protein
MMLFVHYFRRNMWICNGNPSGGLKTMNAQIGVFIDG